MGTKREQELERELKKYKRALSESEQKCDKEKEKRLAEHKKVVSLTKKAQALNSRHMSLKFNLEKEVDTKVAQTISSRLDENVERRVEEEVKKKYPKACSSIIEVLRDMDILNS